MAVKKERRVKKASQANKPVAAVPAVPDFAVSLDRIGKIMAMSVVRHAEEQPEKIRMLASFGYGYTDVAQLLGLTPNAVAVALSRMRTKK